jgi:hypothetical protein
MNHSSAPTTTGLNTSSISNPRKERTSGPGPNRSTPHSNSTKIESKTGFDTTTSRRENHPRLRPHLPDRTPKHDSNHQTPKTPWNPHPKPGVVLRILATRILVPER